MPLSNPQASDRSCDLSQPSTSGLRSGDPLRIQLYLQKQRLVQPLKNIKTTIRARAEEGAPVEVVLHK